MLTGLFLAGCSLHVRPPTLDLGQLKQVQPAQRRSELLVNVRLHVDKIAAIIEQVTVPDQRLGQQSSLASWSLHIEKLPGVRVRTEANRLCVRVPFRGRGTVMMLGRKLARTVLGDIELCAKPRLNPDAILSLRDPSVAVRVERGAMALNSRVLTDKLRRYLDGPATALLTRKLTEVRIALPRLLAPLAQALSRTIPVGKGVCLRPRAEELVLGQPQLEGNFLRFATVLRGRPSLELPCGPKERSTRPPLIEATLRVQQRPSRLIVPFGMGTETARRAIMADLARRGPLLWPGGRVTITGLQIDTSRGAVVVVRLQLEGHVKSNFLGVAMRRSIDGEVVIWGRPQVRDGRVGLTQVQLSFELDDGLAQLGAALRASTLRRTIVRHLSLPTKAVERRARAQLKTLATALKLGKTGLPARIRIQRLVVSGARAQARRLIVETEFEGWIVVQPAPLRRDEKPGVTRASRR